ncbi:hypothetical protein RQN30_08490 [Arcanobacterium hippocoleae]
MCRGAGGESGVNWAAQAVGWVWAVWIVWVVGENKAVWAVGIIVLVLRESLILFSVFWRL